MSGTVIESTTLRLPAADLGEQSPLPSFTGLQRLPDASGSPGLPADMRERIAYGRLASPLPYAIQNGYTRELRPRDLPAIRLANNRFEAYVLPELGGRVWSLVDRVAGEDLVFANSRLQYANFALTDAWCAGGIEWNLGSTGHSTTTSRPVFAAHVETERGPLLRIWEWERTRDLVFSVDLVLADDAPGLLAYVRVRNLDPEPKPLYWWTNIAVPEPPGVRVLAPAEQAWRTTYDGTLSLVGFPWPDDPAVDVSYPVGAGRAADYFFAIPGDRRRWVAALDQRGRGLVQTATDPLRGRKLFLWGSGAGGARWQEWLSGPDRRYLEIQAGLATTQLEHLVLPGRAEIGWAEAYLPVAIDPERCAGPWSAAAAEVASRLDAVLTAEELAERYAWWRTGAADAAPTKQLCAGSSAGLAELTLRALTPADLPGTPFDRPRSDPLRFLVDLAGGRPVDQDAAGAELLIPPISPRWAETFATPADGWWTRLMIAVRAHEAGELAVAERAYRDSHAGKPTAWALRGLAALAATSGAADAAATHYRDAVRLAPECLPLLVEATEHLLACGRPDEAWDLLAGVPVQLAGHGRVQLQRCRALAATGRLAEARAILDNGLEVPDLREGETLEAVWHEAYPDRPLPARYDFRMTAAGSE